MCWQSWLLELSLNDQDLYQGSHSSILKRKSRHGSHFVSQHLIDYSRADMQIAGLCRGLGKKISMISQLKTNQWSHPPELHPELIWYLHRSTQDTRPGHCVQTFIMNPEFSLFRPHTLYNKILNDDACTEYGWHLFGEPLYQNSSWMPSLIIFFRWIWTAARGRKKLHKFAAWTLPSLDRKKSVSTNF